MLKVEPIGQRSRMKSRSGRNVLEFERNTTSISRKTSEIEQWLLLNRKW